MVVGNLGSVLAGAPLSLLAQQVGWRVIFTYAGVVAVVLGATTWVVVRDRPEETASAPGAAPGMAEVWQGLWQVVRNRVGWPAALVNAGIAGSFFAFGGLWAMPFLTQGLGLSRNKASAVLSLYFAGFAVGCLVIGPVSDRLGRRRPVAIVAAHLYALIWLLLQYFGQLRHLDGEGGKRIVADDHGRGCGGDHDKNRRDPPFRILPRELLKIDVERLTRAAETRPVVQFRQRLEAPGHYAWARASRYRAKASRRGALGATGASKASTNCVDSSAVSFA